MNRIELKNFLGAAPKLSGKGHIKYKLWVDEHGDGYIKYKLWVDEHGDGYIQLVENESEGTFPKCLFRIKDYPNIEGIKEEELKGFNPESPCRNEVVTNNKNTLGFFRAALKHYYRFNSLPPNPEG